jgi:cell division protein FtsL
MDKIKEFWNEILENYKDQKTELLLMLLLIAAAIWLCVGEHSEETVAVNSIEAEQVTTDTDETEDDVEILMVEEMTESDQTETESETETELDEEAALELMRHYDRRRMAALGSDFIIPMAMPEGYVRPEYGEEATTAEESDAETGNKNGTESGSTQKDNESVSNRLQNENESETEQNRNGSGLENGHTQNENESETAKNRNGSGLENGHTQNEDESETAQNQNDSSLENGYTQNEDGSEIARNQNDGILENEHTQNENGSETAQNQNDGGTENDHTQNEDESETAQDQNDGSLENGHTQNENKSEAAQTQNSGKSENEMSQDADTTETTALRHVYTLADWGKLPGYGLRIPKDLVQEANPTAEEELENALIEKLASYDGDWSVYVKNLNTGSTITINDRPMKSASVMKLFILGTVYKAFESGDLQRTDEVVALMKDMIIYSSNDASNELLYRLGKSDYGRGIAKVNAFIQEYGFSDMTVEYNGFDNSATVMSAGNYNQVSAKDCGKLLEDIYRREWVSRSVSNEIEQMMLNQDTRYKIPAGLPDGVSCGNKSGEMDTTENDAAIIYADSCDYILVVLSSDWSSKDQAITRIKDISALVYQYLAG